MEFVYSICFKQFKKTEQAGKQSKLTTLSNQMVVIQAAKEVTA
jgi:hypothetical protein